MKIQDTTSLLPFSQYSSYLPSIHKAHHLSLEGRGNGRLFKVGYEVKGLYGPHGREAMSHAYSSNQIDIYV